MWVPASPVPVSRCGARSKDEGRGGNAMRYLLLLAVVLAYGCGSEQGVKPAPVGVGSQTSKREDGDASRKRDDVVRKYGLFPSDEQRDLIGDGIALANKVLARTSRFASGQTGNRPTSRSPRRSTFI